MSSDEQHVQPGSEMDLALSRALEAAKLQPGDATSTSAIVGQPEAFAVEVDGGTGAGSADGD
jgi:hypothetical protein